MNDPTEQTKADQSVPAPAPTKVVGIEVPETIPDEAVKAAAGLGMDVSLQVQRHRKVLIFYPAGAPDGKGGTKVMVGTYAALCQNPEDIKAILETANRITMANVKKINSKSQNPADQLTSHVEADREKKAAATKGKTGLILP